MKNQSTLVVFNTCAIPYVHEMLYKWVTENLLSKNIVRCVCELC